MFLKMVDWWIPKSPWLSRPSRGHHCPWQIPKAQMRQDVEATRQLFRGPENSFSWWLMVCHDKLPWQIWWKPGIWRWTIGSWPIFITESWILGSLILWVCPQNGYFGREHGDEPWHFGVECFRQIHLVLSLGLSGWVVEYFNLQCFAINGDCYETRGEHSVVWFKG